MKKVIKKILAAFGCILLAAIIGFAVYIFVAKPAVIVPASNDPIVVSQDANATVVAWGDPQISNYMKAREANYNAACADIKQAQGNIDALINVGDIAENALKSEYKAAVAGVEGADVDKYLMATGNHDVRLRLYSQTVNRFTNFTNDMNALANDGIKIDALSYTADVNGYKFIVLGTDRTEFEEAYFTQETLDWFDNELADYATDGQPVFVVLHQPLFANDHGLPQAWGSGKSPGKGTVGENGQQLYDIMNKYDNVFMLSGHLHAGLKLCQSYQEIGAIHSLNLPSVGITNADGDYNNAGTGYIIEIYDDSVVFKARDFVLGQYLPEYDITVALTK